MDGGWFLFDDETVYEVDQEDVIEGNFGVRMMFFFSVNCLCCRCCCSLVVSCCPREDEVAAIG